MTPGELRTKRGLLRLTQQDVANLMCVDCRTVVRWESEIDPTEIPVPVAHLIRLMVRYRMTPQDVLDPDPTAARRRAA